MTRLLIAVLAASCWATALHAQTLNDIDTTRGFGREFFRLYQKFEHIRFSGYLQPQFQAAESKGARSFNGGDYAPNVDNRFMLRRGRLRLDYALYNEKQQPRVFFVFQFDGTERGFVTRDFWGRIFENKLELFALTTGIFARPFGQEVLYSSSDRESPERGRMSQLLMKTERDLGAMLTIEPRWENHFLRQFKLDVGLFNGQGLAGPAEFDSRKDLITRLNLKSVKLPSGLRITAAVSMLMGGIRQNTATVFRMKNGAFSPDSAGTNIGKVAPRQYFGADMQIRLPNRKGFTEFRAEYVAGKQSATKNTSETPGTVPLDSKGDPAPLFIRSFNGAYFYFLQHLGSERHQLVLKYDWYDPNSAVSGNAIDATFTWADMKYSTFGFGYVFYANPHLKITTWFDIVHNESTRLTGFEKDAKDNTFTTRVQYRF